MTNEPTIPDAVLASHSDLSRRGLQLLDLVSRDARLNAGIDLADRRIPDWFAAYPYPVQPWPTFVAGAKLRQVRQAAVSVAELIKSVPRRIFDDDPQRIAEYYRLPGAGLAMTILDEPNGLAGALGRGDFLDTEDGFKCLEYNFSAYLGGWQVRFCVAEIMNRPGISELVERPGSPAVYTDPLRALFLHLVEEAEAAGLNTGGELNVAIMLSPEQARSAIASLGEFLAVQYERFLDRERPDLRGRFLFATYDRLRSERGALAVGSTRIHAVLEYHEHLTEAIVFRSFKAGLANLYNGPVATILRDKRNLALLSEAVDSDRFDAAERRAIEDHVPWTRAAVAGPTRHGGERVELRSFALAHRESLVVKDALGARGEAVYIGAATSAAEWEAVLAKAFASGHWIIQERLTSRPYWYRAAAGSCPHDMVWGLFAFGRRYGGAFLRMMPQAGTQVINSARGATEGVLLEIEEEA